MTSATRLPLLALALLIALPGAARAEQALRLDLGLNAQWIRDASYDVVSSADDLSAFSIALGYALPVDTGLVEDVELEVGYDLGGSSAELFGDAFTSELRTHTLQAGLRYRFNSALTEWLIPYVRAGGGYSWAEYDLRSNFGGDSYRQDSGAWSGYAMAGLELAFDNSIVSRLPDNVALTLSAGAGWQWRDTLRFDGLSPDPPAGADPRPDTGNDIDAGPLSLSGFNTRFAAGVRYGF